MTTDSSLDSFLSSNSEARVNTGGRQCRCCANAELKAEIDSYLDKLASSATEVPLIYVFENYLLPKYKEPRHVNSLYNHIRRCLKRDRMTGCSL